LEFHYQKINLSCQKNNLYYRWWSCSTNRSFNRTFKGGNYRKKDQGIEIETAQVNTTTIVETVSATGKSNLRLRLKFHRWYQEKLLHYP
jgi:hypothetical protein